MVWFLSEDVEGCNGWLLDEAGELLVDIFTRSCRCILFGAHEFGIQSISGNAVGVYFLALGEELLLSVKGGDHEGPSQKCVV